MNFDIKNIRIGVVGLGYVGLPLAVEFGKFYDTVGFDVHAGRIAELESGNDSTLETTPEELAGATKLSYTLDRAGIADCNFYIVTVPTPIGDGNRPLLTPLRLASETLSTVIKKGDIVVYESTVYPGATEEFCVPIIEKGSGLKMNEDFFVGYSPERINPGDKEHRLPTILKVTSGSTPEAADYIDAVLNELAMIFDRVGIDTEEVLVAAGTKWNFLPFRPGLVGGHCIGVDPYYLTYKAQQLGYHPQMILAGRRINDNMAQYVVSQIVKKMLSKKMQPADSKTLILGLTFKENCPDVRNTKVVDIVTEMESYGSNVDVWDPWVDKAEAKAEYGIDLISEPEKGAYDVVVIAVAHDQIRDLGEQGIRGLGKEISVVYDIKYVLPTDAVDDRL